MLRWLAINLPILAGMGLAYEFGLIHMVYLNDSSYISAAITALFLIGFVWCAVLFSRDPKISFYREYVSRHGTGHGAASFAQYELLMTRIRPVAWIASALVFLGLIGTVYGFIVALSGIDPSKTITVSNVGQLVAKLVDGMSIALLTTLTGAVLSLWLQVNYLLLKNRSVRYHSRNLDTTRDPRILEKKHGR